MQIICRETYLEPCDLFFSWFTLRLTEQKLHKMVFLTWGSPKKGWSFVLNQHKPTIFGRFLGSISKHPNFRGSKSGGFQDLRKVADRLETWTEKRRSLLQEMALGMDQVVKSADLTYLKYLTSSEQNHGTFGCTQMLGNLHIYILYIYYIYIYESYEHLSNMPFFLTARLRTQDPVLE